MITAFWACKGVIPVDIMLRGETSQSYINVLTEHRKHFKRIWPHMNPTQILLQHDNARPHTSLKTSEAIIKYGWIMLPHLPYSLNLARSHFHPFGALKHAIHSMKFETGNNVIHSQNLATYAGQGMAPTTHAHTHTHTHTHICSSLAQGCKSGQRLCGNTGQGVKASLFILCNFHKTGVGIYRKKKGGITFWSTLLLTTEKNKHHKGKQKKMY